METKLPPRIRRRSDDIIFSLNEDGNTYSVDKQKQEFPDSFHHKWLISSFGDTYFEKLWDEVKA